MSVCFFEFFTARVCSRVCSDTKERREYREINSKSQENKETTESVGSQKTETVPTHRSQQALPPQPGRDSLRSRKGNNLTADMYRINQLLHIHLTADI